MKCQHGSTLTDAHERTTVAGEFILFVVHTDMTSLDVTRRLEAELGLVRYHQL